MDDEIEGLVLCIPVVVLPEGPRDPECNYTVGPCDKCGQDMWYGDRSRALIATNPKIKKWCMICAALAGVDSSSMAVLSRLEKQKPS